MTSPYIVKSATQPDASGQVLTVTPESAGWEYVGFQIYKLGIGQRLERQTEDREVCIVLLSGKANVGTKHEQWRDIGKRMNIFEKTPAFSVYIPSNDQYSVEAVTELEIAICSSPGKGTYKARLIAPENVGVLTRGSGPVERLVHNILPEDQEADSLLVVEVYTPGGNWSSYPSHKHDTLNLPHESHLEETYYHRLNPEGGFGFQRIYTDDRSLDEALAICNEDVVLVPKGYHPVSSPPGFELYYLNVMAGPVRTWKFHNDKDHERLIPLFMK
ncbi:5-deoxy-glucuronate isomerase [Cohnella boryungensis]|uniref:5-deoxy-glucuronate isomerase n=1 Tax=Cohnella boryungensis TaxID=768479 RepID=A0ABV8S6J3_9BACL